MNLPRPGPSYSQEDEAQARSAIAREDSRNMKVGAVFDSIKMRDTATGEIVTVTVASGALVIT